MKKENATKYFEQGMHMLQAKKLNEALEFFNKALEENSSYFDAYLKRADVLSMLGRIEKAETDIQMAKSLNAGSTQNRTTTVQKMDMRNVENVYDDLTQDDDELDFEDDLYDYVFSDDTLESDSLIGSLAAPQTKKIGAAAILEYLDGRREEVPWTHIFEPTQDELTLIYDEGAEPKIISLEQLSRIRLARVPAGFARNKDETCHVEIIETLDGNIFYESIHPVQNQDNVLFGFSTKKDSRFKYTFIPLHNIKKRFQRRHLGQILVDKNLIAGDALNHALDEHNELKKIKFGRILAEQAKILYSAVEAEIKRAYEKPNQQLKIGEILLQAGLVNEEQINQALAYQKRLQNRKLGHFLIEKGILQENEVYMALAEKFRIPFVDLRQQKGSKKVISLLPRELIQKLNILPLSVTDGTLVVATMLPDPSTICEVILKYSPVKEVEFVLAQPSHLKNVINVLFHKEK